jgi:hypothetical protein
MELSPTRYECTEDGQDLTTLVHDEVTAEIPLAYRRDQPRPFRVVVNCPGDGRPHEVAVTGQARYPA